MTKRRSQTNSIKVLFAYNGRVEVDAAGNYYGNELNDKLIERYQFFGDHVNFLVRIRPIPKEEATRLIPFSSPNFDVIKVPEFASPHLFIRNNARIDRIIETSVRQNDVLIARLPSYIGRKAIQYAQKWNKPHLAEIVGCPWDALTNHSLLGKLYAPYARYALKNQLENLPFALYVTEKFLQDRYPCKGFTVGISDVVLQELSRDNLRKRLEKIETLKKHRRPIILGTAAGIDIKYKGQGYVISAIKRLKEEGLDFKYILVGKGTGQRLRKQIYALGIGDQVEFRGQIRHDQVFDYFDELDIYVQPSKQEGLPRAVVEAMSRACPVIGAATGGIPELIDKNFIFPRGNVSCLVDLLKKMSPDQMERQAKQNFNRAKDFESDLMHQKRLAFYTKFKASYAG